MIKTIKLIYQRTAFLLWLVPYSIGPMWKLIVIWGYRDLDEDMDRRFKEHYPLEWGEIERRRIASKTV